MDVGREAHGCHGKLKMARVTGNKLEDIPEIYILQRSSQHTVHLLVRRRWFCEDCFEQALLVDVMQTLGRMSQSGGVFSSI